MSEASMVRGLIAKRGSTFTLVRSVNERVQGHQRHTTEEYGPFKGAFTDPTMAAPFFETRDQSADTLSLRSWRLTCEPLIVPDDSPDGLPGTLLELSSDSQPRDVIRSEVFGEFEVLRAIPIGPPHNPGGYRIALEQTRATA